MFDDGDARTLVPVAPAGMFPGGPWILTSIVYNNTYDGEDIWRMELNGSGLERVTYFNGNASGGQVQGFPVPGYSDATFPIVDPYNSSVFYTAVSTKGITYADRDYFYDYMIRVTPSSSQQTTSVSAQKNATSAVSTISGFAPSSTTESQVQTQGSSGHLGFVVLVVVVLLAIAYFVFRRGRKKVPTPTSP